MTTIEGRYSMSPRIPVIDLAPWLSGDPDARARTAAAVDAALSQAGFLLITGHGVSREQREGVREAARAFFALPTEVKERYGVNVGGRGWLAKGAEANGYSEGTETPPDLKESWTVGADRPSGDAGIDDFWFQPNRWPEAEAPALQKTVEEYMTTMRSVADEVLRLLGAALGQQTTFFTDHTAHPTYTLNINWYPGTGVVGEPQPGQFRIGPHTDFGTVTLLDRQLPGARSASNRGGGGRRAGGLQVYIDPADGGIGWEDAPYDPDALTVNIGDLMARWTNDRWRSTTHRVVDPAPDPAGVIPRRHSMPFFHNANWDASVSALPTCVPVGEKPKYETVLAGPHLQAKFTKATA